MIIYLYPSLKGIGTTFHYFRVHVFADVCACVEKAYKVMPSLPDSLGVSRSGEPEFLAKEQKCKISQYASQTDSPTYIQEIQRIYII